LHHLRDVGRGDVGLDSLGDELDHHAICQVRVHPVVETNVLEEALDAGRHGHELPADLIGIDESLTSLTELGELAQLIDYFAGVGSRCGPPCPRTTRYTQRDR